VTIRAADLALRYLVKERFGHHGVMYEFTDRRALMSENVVEFKEQWIRYPAIDARMVSQIRIHEFSIPPTIPHIPINLTAFEFRRPMVVFTPVRLLAQLAPSMPSS
jgi:hypothetical protein